MVTGMVAADEDVLKPMANAGTKALAQACDEESKAPL